MKCCMVSSVVQLLLIQVLLMGLVLADRTTVGAGAPQGKHGLKMQGCQEGHLYDALPRSNVRHLQPDSFLTVALKPLEDIRKDLSLQVVFEHAYHSPIYQLEITQSEGVGAWVTLRHVETSDIITKVLWPPGLLKKFEETVLTVVLRGGVLRVTAIKVEDVITSGWLSNTGATGDDATTTTDLRNKHSGPYLLLATLRSVHQAWQEPVAVYLNLASKHASIYYKINCESDDLQWAWMAALGVNQDLFWLWLPWILLAIVLVVVSCSLVEWRWRPARKTLLAAKRYCQRDGSVKQLSSTKTHPGLGSLPPDITLGGVSSRAPSPGIDLAKDEIQGTDDHKGPYTNYGFE